MHRVQIMVLWVGVLAGLAVAPSCVARPLGDQPAHRADLPESALELTLTSEKSEYLLGEYPRFSVAFTNKTQESLTLVRPQEGSGWGRFPRAVFSVSPPSGVLPVPPMMLMCGNTTPLGHGAFFRLKPGASATMQVAVNANEVDRGPGTYRLSFEYSIASDDPGAWLGGPLEPDEGRTLWEALLPEMNEVPYVTVRSNPVTITYSQQTAAPLDAIVSGNVSEARWGLHVLEFAPPSQEISVRIVDALRSKRKQDYAGVDFYRSALVALGKHASPNEMDLLWPDIEHRFEANADSAFEVTQCTHEILGLVLLFPGPQREARLRKLITYQKVRGDEKCRVVLNPALIHQIGEVPGADVDRVLKERFDDALSRGRIGADSFAALRNVLVERGVMTEAESTGLAPARQ